MFRQTYRISLGILALSAAASCKPSDTDETDGSTLDTDTTEVSDTDVETETDLDTDRPVDTDEPAPGSLSAPTLVALPFAVQGEATPTEVWTVRAEQGDVEAFTIDVDGPFAIDGDTTSVPDGESRAFTVQYTGSMSVPALATGLAEVHTGATTLTVRLAAVVGAPGLGTATFTSDAYGERASVALPSAPNANGATSWDDKTVIIAVPSGFSDFAGVPVVTHLHGHNATITATAAAQYLVEQHTLSGRNAVLVLPQGPEQAASGDFGQLMDADGHADLIRDVVAVLYREGIVDWPEIGEQVLTSHSGGYQATAAIVRNGGLQIDSVHLFDSLYGESATFRGFADEGGRLISNYTSAGGTVDTNTALRTQLTNDGLSVASAYSDDDLSAYTTIIGFSPATHGRCMVDGRAYARWLAFSGLPWSAAAHPELRGVVQSGNNALVSWVSDPSGGSALVEGSEDGARWETLGTFTGDHGTVPSAPRLRVRWVDGSRESLGSDVYGSDSGAGAHWLVVDGFDRVLDGSYHGAVHDFAATTGNALQRPFDIVSDEAVSAGAIDLTDYDAVFWLLGDEGVGDVTFDSASQAAVGDYLDAGGALVVSGSELGYATSGSWLNGTLGISYVRDDAATSALSDGRGFGVAYPEDYPDVLGGDEVVWTYAGGASAAVLSARVLAVGFPVETLDPAIRAAAIRELRDVVEAADEAL